jgi:hypothetical protein
MPTTSTPPMTTMVAEVLIPLSDRALRTVNRVSAPKIAP